MRDDGQLHLFPELVSTDSKVFSILFGIGGLGLAVDIQIPPDTIDRNIILRNWIMAGSSPAKRRQKWRSNLSSTRRKDI